MNTSWASAKRNPKTRLYKISNYLVVVGGHSYQVQTQESTDGEWACFAERPSDPHEPIKSFTGKSEEECLTQMVQHIEERFAHATGP